MNLSAHPALDGIRVFERGWLSSNNVLILAQGEEAGAVLVDSGHLRHAEQTRALVAHALAGQPLARVVNTHLHSDHCGGNAMLQRAFGAAVCVPPGQAEAARRWDEEHLSYRPTGQHCERFTVNGVLGPGQALQAGGRTFEVLAAPGHDPDSVILFDRASGLLISADALWENGFGVVFPELEGEAAFHEVAAVLDLIETLPVKLVVPGHGGVFTDVAAALARARTRLTSFVNDPQRHARHAAKVLLSYHVMEVQAETHARLGAWAGTTPLFVALWERVGQGEAIGPSAWAALLTRELVAAGAVTLSSEQVRAA